MLVLLALNLLAQWSLWPVIVAIFLYIILMLVVSTNIRFNFFVKAFHQNHSIKDRVVALSFDDGPSENTMTILDILDKFDAKAAFFCIGKKIEENPDIFREIIKRGHVVGNHTYSHTRKMGFISADRFYEEIKECDKIAEKTANVKLNLFRPPFGIINPRTKKALAKTGHQVIGWNVRPYDAITKSSGVIINRITKKLKPGDLILLHDNMDKTAPLLEQLLVILRERKFGTIRPDKLFGIDAYH